MDKSLKLRKLELEERERSWTEEKEIAEREIILDREMDMIYGKSEKEKLSTSKLLILFLFINCTAIEIFTGWSILKMFSVAEVTGIVDFSPLVALIGAVVSEVIGYAVYAAKSAMENRVGGIVYDRAMKEQVPEEETPVG